LRQHKFSIDRKQLLVHAHSFTSASDCSPITHRHSIENVHVIQLLSSIW
jgi:hypothetical protein